MKIYTHLQGRAQELVLAGWVNHNSHQNTWQAKNENTGNGNTETSPSISSKRALLCSKGQERGRKSASSAFLFFFFNGKHRIIENVPPLCLCPCFPCRKSLLHFQQMTPWGYWTTLLVSVTQRVRGVGWYSLCWSVYWPTCGLIVLPYRWQR